MTYIDQEKRGVASGYASTLHIVEMCLHHGLNDLALQVANIPISRYGKTILPLKQAIIGKALSTTDPNKGLEALFDVSFILVCPN